MLKAHHCCAGSLTQAPKLPYSLPPSIPQICAVQGTSIMSQLTQALSSEAAGAGADTTGSVGPDVCEHALFACAVQLAKRFDTEFGGFGGAPK